MKKIDINSFNTGPKEDETPQDKRWWLGKRSERAGSVMKVIKTLAANDSARQSQYQVSAALYGNATMLGVNGLSGNRPSGPANTIKDRLTFNVVQSGVDTLVSKAAKNKPKPMFLTSGGDYKLQRRAKKLEKFVDGVFYENDISHLRNTIRRDSYVWGDGFVHVFPHYGRVKYERVLPSELYCDSVDAFYGKPRQIHRVKAIDRLVLCDLFPNHRAAIMRASPAGTNMTGSYQNISDLVAVAESWHLRSGPEATDGLHSINIEGENLLDEDWNKDYFPFARRRWSSRMDGYFSQGIPEQIENIQTELNLMLWVESRSYKLAGSFKVLVENGSKIVKEHLNNDLGTIITYTGHPPSYVVPPVLPAGFFERKQALINYAYQQIGISQLSANSQKPAGLNSGKALREFNDIESERFLSDGQEEECFALELGRLTVECAKEMYEEDKSFSVSVPGKKFIQTIKWSEVDLEDDEFMMKMFPVSSLPNDPAGRLQTLQEYVQAGMISPRAAKRALDFPDLEQLEDLETSPEDYLHMILEKMVEEGVYTPPEPLDDLTLAHELALEYYAQGKCSNLEEEKLDLLRQFMSALSNIQSAANPQSAPGAGPTAVPMSPPQSDLLPNVPMQGVA